MMLLLFSAFQPKAWQSSNGKVSSDVYQCLSDPMAILHCHRRAHLCFVHFVVCEHIIWICTPAGKPSQSSMRVLVAVTHSCAARCELYWKSSYSQHHPKIFPARTCLPYDTCASSTWSKRDKSVGFWHIKFCTEQARPLPQTEISYVIWRHITVASREGVWVSTCDSIQHTDEI